MEEYDELLDAAKYSKLFLAGFDIRVEPEMSNWSFDDWTDNFIAAGVATIAGLMPDKFVALPLILPTGMVWSAKAISFGRFEVRLVRGGGLVYAGGRTMQCPESVRLDVLYSEAS